MTHNSKLCKWSDQLRTQSFHRFVVLQLRQIFEHIFKDYGLLFTSSAGCILYFPVINISSSNIRYLPLKSKPPISTHEISHQASISQNVAIFHGFRLQLCYWHFVEGELGKGAGFSFKLIPKFDLYLRLQQKTRNG